MTLTEKDVYDLSDRMEIIGLDIARDWVNERYNFHAADPSDDRFDLEDEAIADAFDDSVYSDLSYSIWHVSNTRQRLQNAFAKVDADNLEALPDALESEGFDYEEICVIMTACGIPDYEAEFDPDVEGYEDYAY